jgi:hypothetical protein
MARTQRPADYKVKNIWESCGRCAATHAGGGYINAFRHVHNGICYDCNGGGGRYVSQEQIDRREYQRAYRARKAEEKAAAMHAKAVAEEAAKLSEFDEWKTENADLVEFVSNARAGEPGTFMWDMKFQIFTENHKLTENQTKAVRRIMEQAAKDAETSSPVIEGRITITGKVLTVKEQFSAYGSTIKMLVLDERGFKVWGTMPSAIMGEQCKGKRVTFTAKVTVSDDDETFGFYNRPTKAALVEA